MDAPGGQRAGEARVLTEVAAADVKQRADFAMSAAERTSAAGHLNRSQ